MVHTVDFPMKSFTDYVESLPRDEQITIRKAELAYLESRGGDPSECRWLIEEISRLENDDSNA